MREPREYNHQVPIPVLCVLEIYQETFRHEKPVAEIHMTEPLSPISVGDYLYEVFQIRRRCLPVIFYRWSQRLQCQVTRMHYCPRMLSRVSIQFILYPPPPIRL
jgi:hypothetical protein